MQTRLTVWPIQFALQPLSVAENATYIPAVGSHPTLSSTGTAINPIPHPHYCTSHEKQTFMTHL